MTRPRLLDLFCGAGGCTKGYQRAGFHVTGVDLVASPRYCGDEFVQADVFDVLADASFVARFDAVHASPPCHDKTALRHISGEDGTGWMLPATIARLVASCVPWVVENVPGSEVDMPGYFVTLCGAAFGLNTASKARGVVWLRRHRRFTSNLALLSPACQCSRKRIIGVYGNGDGGGRGWKGSHADRKAVMGIDWMTRDELSQAIPPAYTEWIGAHLLAAVRERAA